MRKGAGKSDHGERAAAHVDAFATVTAVSYDEGAVKFALTAFFQ